MTRHRELEITTQMLSAYLEGEVTRSDATRIESELLESPGLRRRLNDLRGIRDALRQATPELRNLDLVPRLRDALAKSTPEPTPKRVDAWRVLARFWPAAAALLLLVGTPWLRRAPFKTSVGKDGVSPSTAQTSSNEGFRSKSANGDSTAPNRWTGVRSFRVMPDGRTERLAGTVPANAGFVFSYTNLGELPYAYLMLFAVDARKNVRWFYPAYDKDASNPMSIPIQAGVADVPLPDSVHLDWAPGPITIHALFSSQPLQVLDVERRVAQAVSVQTTREPLTMTDALDQVTTTVLVP